MPKLKADLLWWSLLVFVLVIPLSVDISVKVLILVLVISFFVTPRNSKEFYIFNSSWEFAIYLLVLIIGLFYSTDLNSGLKTLETSFSFMAFPIIFSRLKRIEVKQMKIIFSVFIVGLLITCIVSLINATIHYFQDDDVQVFYFYQLTEIIGLQPTYLAYYLIFSITVGLYIMNYEIPPVHPLIGFFILLFFFIVLLLTGGQTAFVSLLLVFSFFILKFFLGERSGNQKLTLGLIIIMVAIMFLISASKNTKGEDNLNDSWDRFLLWDSAIKANQDVIFGVGTGDSRVILNEYFRQHNLHEYADDNLNSHNQFIQIYLSNGIVGLFALLLLLARPLYLAFKNNHSLGVLVFFPFLIYGMTEVFLGRYQGVVFFALLHQVFISFYQSSRVSFSLKEV